MLEEGQSFPLVIIHRDCFFCYEMFEPIFKYICEGGKIYLLELTQMESQEDINDLSNLIAESIPKDREYDGLATPTSLCIKDGQIKDVIRGYRNEKDPVQYQLFVDVIEGKYIDKPMYE